MASLRAAGGTQRGLTMSHVIDSEHRAGTVHGRTFRAPSAVLVVDPVARRPCNIHRRNELTKQGLCQYDGRIRQVRTIVQHVKCARSRSLPCA